ncbi:MAG: hypothetical protein H7Z37_13100 [Pyrinomonadaceae bacterium]|nr:hypothetical protein [Pyrinomonadaceae bacterium]
MKHISLFLASLYLIVSLCGLAQAQIEIVLQEPNFQVDTKDLKFDEQGRLPRVQATITRPKPSDIVGAIKYAYHHFRGENVVTFVEYNFPPIIESVHFNKTVVKVCNQGVSCPYEPQSVEVTTNAIDKDGDTLLYRYEISGGKIIGEDSKVIWDLSGVKAGTYSLSVMVDDGCGICIEPTKKETKVIKCADCKTSPEEPEQ